MCVTDGRTERYGLTEEHISRTDRQTYSQPDGRTEGKPDKSMDSYRTDRRPGGRRDGRAYKHTDRQTDRQTDRLEFIQSYIPTTRKLHLGNKNSELRSKK